MIIIQLGGGLGNQMFQYALYLQLKSLGKEVKIDDVTKFTQNKKRTPMLAPFGITYERAAKKELEQMLDSSLLPWNRVRRKLFGRKKKAYFEEDKRYHPEIMAWDDIYLEGYWQTEKYFETAADEVRRAYDTDRLLQHFQDNSIRESTMYSDIISTGQMSMDDWLSEISSAESVSVHVRRGDYLLPENLELFGNICTEVYYKNAMQQMMMEHPDCRFYLFTNDKEWIRERIEEFIGGGAYQPGTEAADMDLLGRLEVVDLGNRDGYDYAEFVLMSRCKHNILANSSFSWWASYLNPNPDKIVLVPDVWLNGWDCTDIYRGDMRKVKGITIHE